MMIIDTHCHLTDPKLQNDLDIVINLARQASVDRFIVPGTDLRDSILVDQLTKKHEDIFGLIGIYPGNAEEVINLDDEIQQLKAIVQTNKKIVGIGEIGLDCYWNRRNISQQKEVFKAQLILAMELEKPVVIHSRASGKEIKEVFDEMEELPKGQFHCFGEDEGFLKYILNKGFFVSFCGNITYPSAEHLRQMAILVPLDSLLLETDSPYLPPQGKRGERNTPANVRITAEFLAELKKVSLEELSNQTNKNVRKLYGI